MTRIRLLLADDHPVVREGLKRVLDAHEDLEVAGEAGDADTLVALCREVAAEVLVMDVEMPGPGFLHTLKRVQAHAPGLGILVLSMHAEAHFAVRVLRLGVAGFLNKADTLSLLPEAVRRIAAGHRFVTPAVAEYLADEAATGNVGAAPHETLTTREYEVFVLLGSGLSVVEAAARLRISPKTVGTHRARILDKTGLTGNAAIIRYVLEHRLAN